MSLRGRALCHGSRVTIARPVGDRVSDGSGQVASWTTVGVSVPVVIESLTDELVQKVYGANRTVRDRMLVPDLTLTIRAGDGVIVTAGKRVGQVYRVEDARRNDQRANGHTDAALESTDETITPS